MAVYFPPATLYTFLYTLHTPSCIPFSTWTGLGGLQRYTTPPQSLHCLSKTDHQHQHPDLHQILSARHPDCPDWDLAFIRSGKQKHFNNHVKCQTYTPRVQTSVSVHPGGRGLLLHCRLQVQGEHFKPTYKLLMGTGQPFLYQWLELLSELNNPTNCIENPHFRTV